jgi:uncharacterized delta-60 repeat protein
MRFFSVVAVVMAVTACGSVASKEDAGVDTVAPGGASIALEKTTTWVAQNDTATLGFTITRGSSLSGPLIVHVANLPMGVTAADIDVAAGASTGTITFMASTSSTVGATTAVDVTVLEGTRSLDMRPFDVFVAGAHGTIDTTFGTNGKLAIALPDPVVAATSGNGFIRSYYQYPASAGANAGKVLVGVQLDTTGTASTDMKAALVRVNADGTLDTTFNTVGYALLSVTSTNQFLPSGIAVDSQNRILFAARHMTTDAHCRIYVTRFSSTGAADNAYSTYDGDAPYGYCGYTMNIHVLAGDKAIVDGQWNIADGSIRPLLFMLNENGGADTTFGASGEIRLTNPSTDKPTILPNRMYLDSQGRYLIVGTKCNGGYNVALTACESFLGRITSAGAWDTTFGSAGAGHLGYSSLTFGTTSGTDWQAFNALATDAQGYIFTAGWPEHYASATIAKWTSDGSLDMGFGTSGRITPVLVSGGTINELTDIALDTNGKLVGIGYAYNGGPLVLASRFSGTNGAADSTFGTSGVTTATSAGHTPFGVIQADGRILIIGATPRGGNGTDLAVWRVWP